jgi:hypothetical protein
MSIQTKWESFKIRLEDSDRELSRRYACRPFQTVGPATEKARRPNVECLKRGTASSVRSVERRLAGGSSQYHWLTHVDQIQWSAAVHTVIDCDRNSLANALGHIEPVKLIVQNLRQASIVLIMTRAATLSTSWSLSVVFGEPIRRLQQ